MVRTAQLNATGGLFVSALLIGVSGFRGVVPLRGFGGIGVFLLHPETLAAGECFAFPEGCACLQCIDNIFAGPERVAAMSAGGGDEDDLVAVVQLSHP